MDANKEDKKQTVKPSFLECLFSKDKWCNYLKNNNICKEKSKKHKESGIKQVYSSQSENSTPFFSGQQKNNFKKRYGSVQNHNNKLHNPRIGCSFYCSLESKDKKKHKERKTQEWKVVNDEVSEEFVIVDDSETVSENSTVEKISKPNCCHNEQVVIMHLSNTSITGFNNQSEINDTKSVQKNTIEESKEINDTDLPDWLVIQGYDIPRSESMKNEILPYLNRKKLSAISNQRKVSFLSDTNENYVKLKPNNTIVNYVHVDDTNKKTLDNKSEIFNIINKLTSLETKLDDIEDKNKMCEDRKDNEDEVIGEKIEGKNKDGIVFKENFSEREKIFENCCQISCKISKDCEEYYKIYYSQNKNGM